MTQVGSLSFKVSATDYLVHSFIHPSLSSQFFLDGSCFQDGISDSFVQRTEERNGLLTKGHYSYTDGFRRQTGEYYTATINPRKERKGGPRKANTLMTSHSLAITCTLYKMLTRIILSDCKMWASRDIKKREKFQFCNEGLSENQGVYLNMSCVMKTYLFGQI